MKKLAAMVLLALSGPSWAYDGLSSQLSHAAGGALMAGVVTRMYSESEHRAWVGFTVSSVAVIADQSYQISRGADRSSQVLDMASHVLGAAWGAGYADKYMLMPLVSRHGVGLVWLKGF